MPYLLVVVFAGCLAGAFWCARLPIWLGGLYLFMSVACAIIYGWDKAAARAGRRRVPESTLLWVGLAGGWPGALLAQQGLRHKTAKLSFQWRFWATVLVNAGALAWLALAHGP